MAATADVAYIRGVDALPGQILRSAREALKLSPEEAAKRIGFEVVTTGVTQIYRWETAGPEFKPRSPRYAAYVELLGLSPVGADAGFLAVSRAVVELRDRQEALRADLAWMRGVLLALLPIDVRRELGIDESEITDGLRRLVGDADVA